MPAFVEGCRCWSCSATRIPCRCPPREVIDPAPAHTEMHTENATPTRPSQATLYPKPNPNPNPPQATP